MAKKKTKTPKSKVGRPTLLTDKFIREASALARRGNYQRNICDALKVPYGTWNAWLARGRQELKAFQEGKGEYTLRCKFVEEMGKAASECNDQLVYDIVNCDNPSVKLKFYELRNRTFVGMNSKTESYTVDPDEIDQMHKVSATEILAERLAKLFGESNE